MSNLFNMRSRPRARTRRLLACTSLALLCSLLGCSSEPARLILEQPDRAAFESRVYPILLRDCGFPACHGDTARFFRVFGPGRRRLDPELEPDAPATQEEIDQSYTRAVSMLVNEGSIDDSWLLRKPLDKAAGGSEHEGVDAWERNVYYARDDPAYLDIVRWAHSQSTAPSNEVSP